MRLEATRSLFRAFRFQSTHPARGATQRLDALGHIPGISIHAPREGCDWRQPVAFSVRSDFNPRTPRGVRRSGLTRWAISQVFQSTHPARGATVLALLREGRPVLISIHAPREGCDFMEVNRILMGLNISIHAPREGCDGTRRRAGTSCSTISIHAPREGCDLLLLTSGPPAPHFNPRTPRGVRPPPSGGGTVRRGISIHAPREGCDQSLGHSDQDLTYFNPRTPRGVRRHAGRICPP